MAGGARQDVPPFQRGGTFANGDSTITDAANVALYGAGGVNLEGRTYVFEADGDAQYLSYSSLGADPYGRQVTCRIVRNSSGITLKPGRLVHYTESTSTSTAEDGRYETRVDGYCNAVTDRPAGVVDDYLTPGVADGDLFYIVIDGPTRVQQVNSSQVALVVGDRLVPATGTSRTNDDSGRVAKQDASAATTDIMPAIQNMVGFCGAYQATGSANPPALFQANVRLTHP